MNIKGRSILLLISFFCLTVGVGAKEEAGLTFVVNKGQWPREVVYKSSLPGGAVFFTSDGFRYDFYDTREMNLIHQQGQNAGGGVLHCHAYEVSFLGSVQPDISSDGKQSYYHNYFLGNDPDKWASNVPVFKALEYRKLYPGIHMKVYSKATSLKYDLVVESGANPSDIRMKFEGVHPTINDRGDMEIETSVNSIVELAPYAYQVQDGIQKQVTCRYRILNDVLGFEFPDGYDSSQTLVIDPVLKFATYTGSTGDVWGYCSAHDAAGNFYAASLAKETGLPVTNGAYQITYVDKDVAISKYNVAGNNLLFATYCGGNKEDIPTAMIVNSNNELVVSGYTLSTNYPVTSTAYDKTYNGNEDVFVTVFNSSGSSLKGSTYIGGSGSDGISLYAIHDKDMDKSGLCVDGSGNIYVATSTESGNFPVSPGAVQATKGLYKDGCVIKLSSDCSSLKYSTYLGGDSTDCIYDCKLTPNGHLAVCGMGESPSFPLTSGAYSTSGNAFVSILNSSATALVASTKLGAHSRSAVKLSLDDLGNVFVCGNNDSAFVVHSGTFSQPAGRVFIAKLNADLDSMIRVTKLVNTLTPGVAGFVNICGDVVAAIYLKRMAPLPVTPDAFLQYPTVYYFFHMGPAMDSLVYATYYGAPDDSIKRGSHTHGSSTIDTSGVIWFSACDGISKDLLQGTQGSYSPTSKSGIYDNDHLSVKFDMEVKASKPHSVPVVPDTGCVNSDVYFSNNSLNAYDFVWYFGDGDTSHAKNPVHQYKMAGHYVARLQAFNSYSCKYMDESYGLIYIDSIKIKSAFSVVDTACEYAPVSFVNNSVKAVSYLWDFGDGDTSTLVNATHIFGTKGVHTVKLLAYNPALCNKVDTSYKKIYIDGDSPGAGFVVDKLSACTDMPIKFINTTSNANSYQWDFGDGDTSSVKDPIHNYSKKWGSIRARLIAINNNLCVSHDTAYQLLDILTPLQIELADTFVCGDEPFDWGVKLIYGNKDITYTWQPVTAILSQANTQKVRVDPKKATKYIVTVTDTIPGMCSHVRSDTGNVIIVDYPTGTYASSNSPVCEGDMLSLNAGTDPRFDRINYTWTGPGSYGANGQVVNRDHINDSGAGIYHVAIDNQGCVVYEQVEVQVKPVPVVKASSNSPVLAGKDLQLNMDANMQWDSLLWTGPAGFASTDQSPVIYGVKPDRKGSYTVKVIADGCIGGAVTIVTIDEPDSQYVKLYPNPTNGRFYIEGKCYNEQQVPMLILNAAGQKIYAVDVVTDNKHFKQQITLPAAASGEYVLWLLMDARYWSVPFTVTGKQ